LCCTDLHALGPISRVEAREMRQFLPGSVHMDTDIDGLCFTPGPDGGCVNLKNGLCNVHAKLGAEAKPVACRRFPYGLVATPDGGRVTTEHRCPCRTLGERPPLDVADAEKSLRDRAGRLETDGEVSSRVRMAGTKRVAFARYAEIEAVLRERLAAGERAESVLARPSFPELKGRTWAQIAAEHHDDADDTAGGQALAWFGDALLVLTEGRLVPKRPRPWREGFERARKRSKPRPAEAVINDWLQDELWAMRWVDWRVSFEVARAELATRLAVVRSVTRRLRRMRVRADQATAEAIMVTEIAACSDDWPKIVRRFSL
jgi:hypothetical protein